MSSRVARERESIMKKTFIGTKLDQGSFGLDGLAALSTDSTRLWMVSGPVCARRKDREGRREKVFFAHLDIGPSMRSLHAAFVHCAPLCMESVC